MTSLACLRASAQRGPVGGIFESPNRRKAFKQDGLYGHVRMLGLAIPKKEGC